MEKDALRNQLFAKYFEVDDGILATDFVTKLSFVREVWSNLHSLCRKNIEHFDFFSSLEKVRLIKHLNKNYLILKLNIWDYVIIDMERQENLNNDELFNLFDIQFFRKNFDETDESLHKFYRVERFANVPELIDFFTQNQDILSLSSTLHYELNIGEAYTYLSISFASGSAQMGFWTQDQFLYEHLHLNYNLTPSGMQDAHERIGRDRMLEMFKKIENLKIPREVIPSDLLQKYLEQCELEKHKLQKV